MAEAQAPGSQADKEREGTAQQYGAVVVGGVVEAGELLVELGRVELGRHYRVKEVVHLIVLGEDLVLDLPEQLGARQRRQYGELGHTDAMALYVTAQALEIPLLVIRVDDEGAGDGNALRLDDLKCLFIRFYRALLVHSLELFLIKALKPDEDM